MRRRNLLLSLLVVAALAVCFAQKSIPKPPDKSVMAIENVRQLLLVMDADKNGKISKQQWMAFMAAEFDRLDLEKKGLVDQTVVRQSTVYVKQARSADLGR